MSPRSALTAVTVLALAGCEPEHPRMATEARAHPVGPTATVTTRAGRFQGRLRGGDADGALVLATADGVRTFPRAAVLALELDGGAGAEVVEAFRDAAPDARQVQLTVTGDAGKLLRRRHGAARVYERGSYVTRDGWMTRTDEVCAGPCAITLRLHPEDELFLDHAPIELPPGQRDVHVDVRDGSSVGGPLALLFSGAGGLVPGSAVLAYGLRNGKAVETSVGAAVTAGTTALAVGGLVWLLTSKPRAVRISALPLGVVRF